MRVIFLDIDGVILPVGAMDGMDLRAAIRDPYAHLDAIVAKVPLWTVAHLKTLASEIDGKFVLISSWRGLFSSEFLQVLLTRLGLVEQCHKDWEAPMQGFPPRPIKGRDIAEWLGDHLGYQGIVIDDENLRLREDFGLDLIEIKPISTVGFSRDDLARALRAVVPTVGLEPTE